MNKMRVILAVVILSCLLTLLPQPALAASNPYPKSQTIGGITTIPCTYYAWQQAYDRMGIVLPAWGNAINWYDRAFKAGYSVGVEPKANSIAVWSSSAHSYGHVAFVTAVNGDKMTVNEGGRSDKTTTNGIVNGQVLPSKSGSTWYNRTLIGFIYLDYKDVEVYNHHPGNSNTITDTNAILYGVVHKAPSVHVEKFGIRIRTTDGTYANGWSYYHNASSTYSETVNIKIWFDIQEELGVTLKHATSYTHQFYAKVNGKEYWSEESTFVTTGEHSFDGGTVTKEPTCEETGVKTYTCTICDETRVEGIAALTHNWVNNVCSFCGTQNTNAVPSEGYYEYFIFEGAAVISGVDVAISGNAVIPSTLGGYPVSIIDLCAFKDCVNLTGITIPSSIKKIAYEAFSGCTNLSAVYISDIAAWCNIDFYDISSNPLDKAHNLYLNGKLVTDLVIPSEVTRINKYAFHNCFSITSVILPNSILSIGERAFHHCESLENVIIPSSVASIESQAFAHCVSLTDVIIPNGVVSLNGVFYNCISLSTISIPVSVVQIDRSTFYPCINLKNVYYAGSPEDWSNIAIGENNEHLTNATINCNSTSIENDKNPTESAPTKPDTDNNTVKPEKDDDTVEPEKDKTNKNFFEQIWEAICKFFESLFGIFTPTKPELPTEPTKSEEYIYYSDLFYVYPQHLTANAYLPSIDNRTYNARVNVLNEYITTSHFKASAWVKGIGIASSVKDCSKYIIDTIGMSNFELNNDLDKANQKFVDILSEISISSLNEITSDNKYVSSLKAASDIAKELSKIAAKSEAYYKGLPAPELYESFMDRTIGLLEKYCTQLSPQLPTVKENFYTIFSTSSEVLGDLEAAVEFSSAFAMTTMMQEAQLSLIEDIIRTQDSSSFLYKGMTRLQTQLTNGFVNFASTFLNEKLYDEIAKIFEKKIGESLGELVYTLGGKSAEHIASVCGTVVKVVHITNNLVFKEILGFDYDKYASALMLHEYASDLYISVKNQSLVFCDRFESKEIQTFENLYNAWIAMNKASFEECQSIAKHNSQYGLKYMVSVMDYFDTENAYEEYLDGVKMFIRAIPFEQRYINNYSTWDIRENTVISGSSDTIEDGILYIKDFYQPIA